MRVTLVHNPQAGAEYREGRELVSLLREAGHEVRYRATAESGWRAALREPTELVAAAGGDGLVSDVFKALTGGSTPVTILPLGTANNIARSLGFLGAQLPDLVRAWPDARTRRYDVGEAVADGARVLFVECMGAGLFAALFARAGERRHSKLRGNDKIELGLRLLAELLDEAEPQSYGVTVDDRDVSGEYFAVEAMNAREAGPNVPLAPYADTADGRLDLVLVGAAEREALAAYVTSRREGNRPPPPELPVHRGRRLRIVAGAAGALHVDDDLWPGGRGAGAVEATAAEGVTVLCP